MGLHPNKSEISLSLPLQVTKFVERGVPPMLRGDLWKRLLDVEAIKATIGFKFNYNVSIVYIPDSWYLDGNVIAYPNILRRKK